MLPPSLAKLLATTIEQRTYAQYSSAANELRTVTPEVSKRPTYRIAVLRNFTIEPLLPVIAVEAFEAGVHPELYVGDFDSISADVFNPDSALYHFKPDFIFVAQWLDTISPALTTRFISSKEKIAAEVDRVRQHTHELLGAIRANSKATVVFNNFPLPAETTLGILDGQSTGYQTQTIIQLNQLLLDEARAAGGTSVLDLMSLVAAHGSVHCLDHRHWHLARAPLSQKALLPIGRELGKFFRALRGKTKKCLVLDCDNTLWGGVIGEDGMSGIKLGTSYPGSTFLSFQEEILNLHDRGVILALCSKNNLADVLQVLREHPDMLLREKHFASWQINWDDKVTNLRRIANELNIGLDSFVFVDDSDFETGFVRENLPDVEVVQMPKSGSAFRAEFTRRGFFDSLTFSAEDQRRNEMYGDNRQRKQIEATSGSLQEFLAKLELEVDIGRPSELEIPRVAQLTQKTNQFNLTTRRYTEADIRAFLSNPGADVFALRLKDKVADMGLVGVAIVTYAQAVAEIDSFLLSCRVIGRGVEDALLSTIVNHGAQKKGARKVVGRYVPTAKNAQVKDFFPGHQFQPVETATETKVWEREVQAPVAPPAWIKFKTGATDAG